MAAVRRKRKRTNSAVVLLNGLLSLLVIGIIVAGVGAYFAIRSFYAEGPKTEQTAFLVPNGATWRSVGGQLEDQGLISNNLLLQGALKLGIGSDELHPGQFLIPARASMSDIVELLTTGKPQEFFVNVVPGETSWQVAEALNDPGQSLTGAAIPPPREGTLLAVRHDFFPGDTRQSVLDAMQKKMADEVDKVWAEHDPAIDDVVKSKEQLVTLASLVEKETGLDTERPEVASVFVNRLRKGMRLQTDPSVIYGITLGRTKLERGLTTKDLSGKSPYNTYQIDGLPPGPIANPGVEALMAVAHPAATNNLYFVAKTADPADGHYFSATYAEHKKNVALYRKAVKDQAAEDESDAAKDALEAEQAKDAGDETAAD